MVKDNCWPCIHFTLDAPDFVCAKRVASFPKRCGHYDREPGHDYDERIYENNQRRAETVQNS
jgi:hypothetical protein